MQLKRLREPSMMCKQQLQDQNCHPWLRNGACGLFQVVAHTRVLEDHKNISQLMKIWA